jgi:hypothetical protein
MELLDRYLNSVRTYLPSAGKDDVLRELADEIRSRMEDREGELGRPLTEAEQEALLRQVGNPAIVASRYSPDQSGLTFGRKIIGPELFPLYKRILAIAIGIMLMVSLLAAIILHRNLLENGPGLLSQVALQFGIITTIFALAQLNLSRNPDQWTLPGRGRGPNSGPSAFEAAVEDVFKGVSDVPRRNFKGWGERLRGRDPHVGVRLSAFAELFFTGVGILSVVVASWVLSGSQMPWSELIRPGLGWRFLVGGTLLMFLLSMAAPTAVLIRPTWVSVRHWAKMAILFGHLAVLSLSLLVGHWVADVYSAPNHRAAVELAAGINHALQLALTMGVVIYLVSICVEGWRGMRRERRY